MKSFITSMSTRVFVILVLGVVLSALITLGLALNERKRLIGEFRDHHAVERVAQFVLSLETVPAQSRAPYFSSNGKLGMNARIATDDDRPTLSRSPRAMLLDRRLADGYEIASTELRAGDCVPPFARAYRHQQEPRPGCEVFLVTLPDGMRVRISALPPRPPPAAPKLDLVNYGIAFLLSIAAIAAVIARMTIRPLKELAQAATELGNNIERPPLPERGASELRQAAAAFNAMQSRIREHIRQRSHILAAVTHDLQTPLTRLRLRLENVEDAELRGKLINDLSAMQAMVREGLDLASSMDSAEPMQRLDIDSLVDSVCADAVDAGQDVSMDGTSHTSLMARPTALRRCLTNLIDNAVKYGGFARVTIASDGAHVSVRVRDGGPGIPENEREKVFEPFYRIEGSRSRETGGTGLGLTIARNIATQHGGSIELRTMNGESEAVLRLPRAHPSA